MDEHHGHYMPPLFKAEGITKIYSFHEETKINPKSIDIYLCLLNNLVKHIMMDNITEINTNHIIKSDKSSFI